MRPVRVLAAAIALVAACAGCDWAQFGADAGHTNANPFEPTFTTTAGAHFTTAWSAPCGCLPPLEAGGIVYVADGYGGINPRTVTLRALDAATGTTRWTDVLPNIDQAQFAAIGNGLAYVVAEGPTLPTALLGLDATSGALRWSTPIAGTTHEEALPVAQGAALDGTTLFVAAVGPGGSTVSAIDTVGRVVWSAYPPGQIDAVAVDAGTTVYVASHVTVSNASPVHFLTGYAEAGGARQSSVLAPAFVVPLIVANGLVYLESAARHPETGAPVWSAPEESIVAVDGSRAITVSATGDLVARNALTGVQIWRATGAGPTAASTSGQTVVVAGALVFVAHPHVVDVRSLADGSDLGATPAVAMDVDMTPAVGHLFVDGAATLYAFAPTAS